VRLSELTSAQYQRYFEKRLTRIRVSGRSHMAHCPWHDDKNPSLSVNFEKGVWKCHAGCGEGGLIDFEKKFGNCDDQSALARIADLLGLPQKAFVYASDKPEAVYTYRDVFERPLFEVLRKPGKRFVQRRPNPEGGGWIYETTSIEMVLYNLPTVATAKQILVVEGEKDADNLTVALGDRFPHIWVKTCPRGAGKWHDSYSTYFAGKQVVIIPDNDEAGEKHAQEVARTSWKYTHNIRVIHLPGIPEKGDVSDWLAAHSVDELPGIVKATPFWRPAEADTSLFMSVSKFEEKSADTIQWLIEGIIQKGANGLVIARPKSGKSFLVADLAMALASGQSWLGFFTPQRTRVGLVSREDNGSLTQWRVKKMRGPRKLTAADLDGWFYINAKGMSPKIMLDNDLEVKALIEDLRKYRTEFLIMDVMRVLHSANENDNTEMQRVIDVLNQIQDSTGVSICLVHHDNKREDATLTERARGASAIAGGAEFICGVRVVEEDDHIREFCCELKAGIAPNKFYWGILDRNEGVALERIDWEPPKKGRKGSTDFDTEQL